MLRIASLIVLALVAAGCARKTPLPGLHIDDQGRVARSTPPYVRQQSEAVLAADIQAALGADWVVAVAIEPDPQEDFRRSDQRHWYWEEIAVAVRVAGPGELPLSTERIGAIVAQRLAPHLRRPEALSVTVGH